jgi:hypothetical protein
MKSCLLAFALLLSAGLPGFAAPPVSSHAFSPDFDDTTRFIFYSVLEGCYEDGLSNKDVDQILMKKGNWHYFHFIYACPICGATIWALEAYRGRPEAFYSLKEGHGATFGPGLSGAQRKQLFSDDPHQRLIVIHSLVKDWIARRMDRMNLSDQARKDLLEALGKKRDAGMRALESFRKDEPGSTHRIADFAPAYTDLDECAVCNGAVGKPMKLPGDKPAENGSPTPASK